MENEKLIGCIIRDMGDCAFFMLHGCNYSAKTELTKALDLMIILQSQLDEKKPE